MTEELWMKLIDAKGMLEPIVHKVSERKLQLYSCACCRLVWHLLSEQCRRIVECYERYADREVEENELMNLFTDFSAYDATIADVPQARQAAEAIGRLGLQWLWGGTAEVLRLNVPSGVGAWVSMALEETIPRKVVRRRRAGLLHDIVGPVPFRSISLAPSWLTWNNATVPAIARHIYDDRAFYDLPILADALEDAGCTDPDILAHCRQGGEHVRGCWVVDLILGKT